MFNKLKRQVDSEKIDNKQVNEVVSLTKRILKVLYVLIIIAGIYAVTIIVKEWQIMAFIKAILKIVAPLFIGIIIAWLFDPFVRKLKKKGIRRGLGAAIAYVIFIGLLVLIISAIIPLLSGQINDFVKMIPSIFDSIKSWAEGVFDKLGNIGNFNSEAVKIETFAKIENFGSNLANSLPEITVNFVKSFFSGLGVFVVGLIIGFFLLVSFDSADNIMSFLPKKMQKDFKGLTDAINMSLRKFVQGTLVLSTLIFVTTSLGLWISGIKSPLLFGLFCGITNIIPYAGPYIGGIPAVIVAFSQGPLVGIGTLITIVIVQFLEGNFLQPIVMSKTMKLHPVTIMLGLLIFGYFWGIIGMIVATPVISACKIIIMYFDEKYDVLKFNNENEDKE